MTYNEKQQARKLLLKKETAKQGNLKNYKNISQTKIEIPKRQSRILKEGILLHEHKCNNKNRTKLSIKAEGKQI